MSDDQTAAAGKAPWHLRVVGIAGLLWSSMGAYDYFMTQTRKAEYLANFTPAQVEYFLGVPGWVVACWAIGVWGGVAGCLLLLLRRRLAVPVLLASLIGAILLFTYNYLLSEGLEVMGGGASALIFPLIIVLIAIGLWWYARRARAQGLLN